MNLNDGMSGVVADDSILPLSIILSVSDVKLTPSRMILFALIDYTSCTLNSLVYRANHP